MESVALDAQAQDKLSGVTKEKKTVRIGLRPGVSPQLIIQEVGRQLEGWRGKYHKEVGGILLDHGKITVKKVVSIPQDSWTAVPVLAVIEGIFYVIKMPEVGTKLYGRVKEKSSQQLTCHMMGGVQVLFFSNPAQWEDLYVGQNILFKVDFAIFDDNNQFGIVGSMVEPDQEISFSDSSGDEYEEQRKIDSSNSDKPGKCVEHLGESSSAESSEEEENKSEEVKKSEEDDQSNSSDEDSETSAQLTNTEKSVVDGDTSSGSGEENNSSLDVTKNQDRSKLRRVMTEKKVEMSGETFSMKKKNESSKKTPANLTQSDGASSPRSKIKKIQDWLNQIDVDFGDEDEDEDY